MDVIRAKESNKHHCAWLRRDPNACMALPAGIDGVEAGTLCPHNIYIHKASIFENRDGVADTVDRLFRLVSAAEVGILSEKDLDTLSVTELLTARGELDRQQAEKTKTEYERAKVEAAANQGPNIDFDAKERRRKALETSG